MTKKYQLPDKRGYYGPFGGRFVPETLLAPLEGVDRGFQALISNKSFLNDFRSYMHDYVGRPTPLFEAKRLFRPRHQETPRGRA
jgi:tryptophan synthase beta chain